MIGVFYILAISAIAFALFILFSKNVLHAAFALVVVFFAIAGLYVLMGVPFVGVTQVLVYIGGVVVFIVFGVMLTNRLHGKNLIAESNNRFLGYLLGLLIIVGVGWLYTSIDFDNYLSQVDKKGDDVNTIGVQLMSEYLIPFELAGILLLLALIAAVAVSGHEKKTKI